MKSRLSGALRSLCALVPAGVAALGASSTALAAHDDGVIRTVGVGSTGIFRALDLLVAAPMMLLPLGTRSLRAALAGAIVTGIAGAIAYDLARALTAAVIPSVLRNASSAKSERLMSAVSAIAVLTALLSPAWQAEAAAPGGAVTGALLVLLALRFASTLPAVGLVLGAAASYEPLTFAATLVAVAPTIYRERKTIARPDMIHAGCMFALGLVPLAVGLALKQRPPEVSLVRTAIELGGTVSPVVFALDEIGVPILIAGASGMGIAIAARRAIALPIILVALVGAGALVLRAPSGPNRYAPAVLALVVAFYMLVAPTLGLVVLAIARARVPFAEASAALVVVLELVLPVRSADEAFGRREARAPHAAAIWNDVAWGTTAPASVLLIHDRATMGRIASARATGSFRADLIVVPAYQVQSREGEHALLAEPKLMPLYRDMALDVPPEELSLAQLGGERPVHSSFDPKWDRSLSRHLVPVGLTSRFEPEPRGASDRMRALETFSSAKDRLVRIAIAKKDPELAAATTILLRARAIGMGATGERDVLSRALDDLRAFAPDDPVGAVMVRRLVTTKGPIEVKDLRPY